MLTRKTINGINTSLNEANLLSFAFQEIPSPAAIANFACLQLDENMKIPNDRRVAIKFSPISDLYISLRNGRWDDKNAEVLPMDPNRITEVIESMGQTAIYGWEFIDPRSSHFREWKNRLSYKYNQGHKAIHICELFQDNGKKILDLRFSFNDITVLSPSELTLEKFIEYGKRCWDNIFSKNMTEEVKKFGIFPAK